MPLKLESEPVDDREAMRQLRLLSKHNTDFIPAEEEHLHPGTGGGNVYHDFIPDGLTLQDQLAEPQRRRGPAPPRPKREIIQGGEEEWGPEIEVQSTEPAFVPNPAEDYRKLLEDQQRMINELRAELDGLKKPARQPKDVIQENATTVIEVEPVKRKRMGRPKGSKNKR